MSQMISSGSGAAISSTKSHSPSGCFSSSRSTSASARVTTASLTLATADGVNPLETSERRRKWRGSSMLMIDPKNSFSSWLRSPMFDPLPEQKSVGLRLTAQTSSWRTAA